MGYNKTTWQTGDTVTAEKLNNMENGIAANDKFFMTSIVYYEDGDYSEIQNTWQELYNAMEAGKIIYCLDHNTENNDDTYLLYMITYVGFTNEEYYTVTLHNVSAGDSQSFEASSASSKPIIIYTP